MRTLSQTIQDVLAADYGETKDVVTITIPEQLGAVPYPETVLNYANGDGVRVGSIEYQNKLRSVSAIKFSLSKAPDSAEISLENVSKDLGFVLTDFQRALDGSKVEIKRLFKTAGGLWEPDTLFVGQSRNVKVSQESIDISLSSDMAKRGTYVAGRTITQRCLFRFNVSGSGVGPLCGWVTSLPGNALSCDKGLDTPNGCQSHGNQHRFGGVPSFTDLNASNGYDPLGSGWGEGSGGGWCVAIDSWVMCEFNGYKVWVQAQNLRQDDVLVSIDKFGRVTTTIVNKATVGKSSSLYTISTSKGYSLSCSPTHPVMKNVSSDFGIPVNTLVKGDKVVVYDVSKEEHFLDEVVSIEVVDRESLVVLLELEEPNHLFLAGLARNGAIVSHNMKPIYTDYPSQYQIFNIN